MSRYSLSCPQGHSVEVSPTQAGLLVHCHCGAELQVPTMRELSRLPKIETTVETHPGDWSFDKGLKLLGILLLLTCPIYLAYLISEAPEAPAWNSTPELMERQVDQLTLLNTWNFWKFLQPSIEISSYVPGQEIYEFQMRNYYYPRMIAGGILSAVGLVSLIWGFLAGRSPRPKMKRPA